MKKILQSEIIKVQFDELDLNIHKQIFDDLFITTHVNERFIIEHKYILPTCGKKCRRATDATINGLLRLLYGETIGYDGIQLSIIIEFINIYIIPERHEKLFSRLPASHIMMYEYYSELYNFLMNGIMPNNIATEDFLEDLIDGALDRSGLKSHNLTDCIFYDHTALNNLIIILNMSKINLFKILVKKYELHEAILISKGMDISVLYNFTRYQLTKSIYDKKNTKKLPDKKSSKYSASCDTLSDAD